MMSNEFTNDRIDKVERHTNHQLMAIAVVSGITVGVLYNQVKLWNRMNVLENSMNVSFTNQISISEALMEIMKKSTE